MTSVREVYEHVYETVDIQGSHDVRASATAKATVAAFAASEGHAHPRVVELPKTEEGKPRPYDLRNSGRTPLATLKVVTNKSTMNDKKL